MRINFTQLYYILDAFFLWFMMEAIKKKMMKNICYTESTFQKYSYYLFIYFEIHRDK